jgi:GMP synthase-like glutamine amidotransferase
MSKVLILRFEKTGGPGYFGRYLDRQRLPYELVRVDQGDPLPESIAGVSGVCLLGGVMSANDDQLPWVPQVLSIIRDAHGRSIPLLGHCLGGQLIARALGGSVTRSPAVEIGWLPVEVINDGGSPAWCRGLPPAIDVFQWHNETFSIPPGATKLFHRDACPNQGFQLGNTLALQFHLEVLPETVGEWASLFLDDSHRSCETVHSREHMLEDILAKAERSHRAADHIYAQWCENLA